MESTKYLDLPIVGMIQHGMVEENTNRIRELGYFIGKTKDNNMQEKLNKFNEQYKGSKSIEICFFDDNPFTIKYSRYTKKMGEVCSCNENSSTANEKTPNGWRQIECSPNCEYRQIKENQKPACNRIGWLRFTVPSVCRDRIFLMKVTSQTSINRIKGYIEFLKLQKIPIQGYYTLFLSQEEQTNRLGKTFNNYILNIDKKEDLVQNQIPKTTENKNELSINDTKVIDNVVTEQVNNAKTETVTQVNNTAEVEKKKTTGKTKVSKDTSKSETKVKTNKNDGQASQDKVKTHKATSDNKSNAETKSENKKENSTDNTQESKKESLDNVYGLIKTFYKKIKIKEGEEKEYLVGEFADINDQMCQICIRPEDGAELENCELGTIVRIDKKEIGDLKFAMKLEYIQKLVKKNVA